MAMSSKERDCDSVSNELYQFLENSNIPDWHNIWLMLEDMNVSTLASFLQLDLFDIRRICNQLNLSINLSIMTQRKLSDARETLLLNKINSYGNNINGTNHRGYKLPIENNINLLSNEIDKYMNEKESFLDNIKKEEKEYCDIIENYVNKAIEKLTNYKNDKLNETKNNYSTLKQILYNQMEDAMLLKNDIFKLNKTLSSYMIDTSISSDNSNNDENKNNVNKATGINEICNQFENLKSTNCVTFDHCNLNESRNNSASNNNNNNNNKNNNNNSNGNDTSNGSRQKNEFYQCNISQNLDNDIVMNEWIDIRIKKRYQMCDENKTDNGNCNNNDGICNDNGPKRRKPLFKIKNIESLTGEELLTRNLTRILNKISKENFDNCKEKLFLEMNKNVTNKKNFEFVIELILSKSMIDTLYHSKLYPLIFIYILRQKQFLLKIFGESSNYNKEFRKILITLLQKQYIDTKNECNEQNNCDKTNEEMKVKTKAKYFATVNLIGYLYNNGLIDERIILYGIIGQILLPNGACGINNESVGSDIEIQSICQLLSVCGQKLDHSKTGEKLVSKYLILLKQTSKQREKRLDCLVQNVEQLRKNGWTNYSH